ncbi:hypothetical protein POX_d05753 [Penicillium oxalicum]|uniref:hypothetical protein n=1 Tax=Penicillium oxalicum TaxID=69781 RepID=UPI0020B7EB8C|nr:hypothetical protein POX_d05753 [Penicillium oxalicum]KAI2790246.1 hypothetical protein POX_d05753 [Penicillium oxalicum]
MNNQAQSRRNEHLTWVYDQLQGCGEIYLEPAHLRTLQILALPTHVSDNGEVLFHPRFFKAHPARVLGEYPVNQSVMGPANPPRGVPPLCDPPSLEKELWNHVHIADDGDRIQAARDSLADRLSQYWHEWTCVQRVHGHIQSHILAPRFGRPEGSTLCELGALQPSLLQEVASSNDPPTASTCANNMNWQIEDLLEDSSRNTNPHTIMSVLTEVDAGAEPASLTLHEVLAAVTMMRIRTSHGPWTSNAIHPLLMISYTGDGCGRITQVSLHGETLILQYSPLWDFQHSDSAPVELFVRYYLSGLGSVSLMDYANPDADALTGLVSSLTLDTTAGGSSEKMDVS